MTMLDPLLAAAVADAQARPVAPAPTAARAVGLVDLTSLNDTDTAADIRALCARAMTPAGAVAAVCIHIPFVALARECLAGTPVRIATVVNFPAGAGDAEAVARETAAAVAAGADEIDVVTAWPALLKGDRGAGRAVLAACRQACAGRTLKVILESGALDDAGLIRQAGEDALAAGADFLKTSTGKRQPAATLEATALLLDLARGAGRPVGVKPAGGIRDTAQAATYLALADRLMGEGWATPATFRFGASGLLDALLASLGHGPAGPAGSY